MATPEQNALLALQLFGAPVDQFNRQNDQRTSLIYRLAESQGADDLKRELANQQYQKALELAALTADRNRETQGYIADRQDTRDNAITKRQDSQLKALQTREDTKAKEAQDRQDNAIASAEKKQLRGDITKAYAIYADEAANLGEDVRERSEFDDSVEGLGSLQAEMARLHRTRIQRDQSAAAQSAVGELDDASKQVADHQKNLEALMKPHPEDIQFAKTRALDAVRQALDAGGITGAPKVDSSAGKKGLAALQRGDDNEAGKLLGMEAINSFQQAYEQSLMAAPNAKARMQQVTVAQQNFQQAQRNLATIQSDLRKAAPTNNALATKLTERRSGLESLMMPGAETAPQAPRSFDAITPPRAAPATQSPGVTPTIGSPQTSTARAVPNLFALQLGGLPQGNTAAAPAIIGPPAQSGGGMAAVMAPASLPATNIAPTTGSAFVDERLKGLIAPAFAQAQQINTDPATSKQQIAAALQALLASGKFGSTPEYQAFSRGQIAKLLGQIPDYQPTPWSGAPIAEEAPGQLDPYMVR